MKEIQLTQNRIALVSNEDYEYLNQFPWCVAGPGYPQTGQLGKKYMHQVIMNPSKGFTVDHIDGNKFNNQRNNLRVCTSFQNSKNHLIHKANTSGYKGVSWMKNKKRWRAYIKLNYKQIWLGLFDTREEAAKAYNQAALKYFGEFARLNIIN